MSAAALLNFRKKRFIFVACDLYKQLLVSSRFIHCSKGAWYSSALVIIITTTLCHQTSALDTFQH